MPGQRILPAAGSINANPAEVIASPFATLILDDVGGAPNGSLQTSGPASTLDARSGSLTTVAAGSGVQTAEVMLSPDNAQLRASGAGGVASVSAGLLASIGADEVGVNGATLTNITGPEVNVGDAGGTLGFRGVPAAAIRAVLANTDPVQDQIDRLVLILTEQGLASA